MYSSKIISINGVVIDNSIEYFTHDSMYALKRKVYSRKEAVERKILKFNLEGKDSYWKVNAYPCNSGLILFEGNTSFALGYSFSHALMC
jgi:hypothetical protein